MAESLKDSIDIEASTDEIFAVATDFEKYPEWNSGIKKVEVKESDGEGRPSKVWFEVDAQIKTLRYTLEYDYSSAPDSFSWDLLEGDPKELQGSYTFDGFGDQTEVIYEMKVDPGFPIPKLLRKQAEKRIAKAALEDLKKRVESLK